MKLTDKEIHLEMIDICRNLNKRLIELEKIVVILVKAILPQNGENI